MFTKRQKFRCSFASPIYLHLIKVDDNGKVTTKLENASVKLPEPEKYDLNLLVKAGVDLKRTNTLLIDKRPIHSVLEAIEEFTDEKSTGRKALTRAEGQP